MSKATPFLSSGNAGEFSPRMDARIDFDKYSAASARALNLVCLPEGGRALRPGFRNVNAVKVQGTFAGLIPFEPVSDTSYMLEFGHFYMRVYRNQALLTADENASFVFNGDFDTTISGWTNSSTGSASIVWYNGLMKLVGASDGVAAAEQAIAVSHPDQTKTIVTRFAVAGDTPLGKLTVQVGTASGLSDLFSGTGFGIGSHTIGFVPGAGNIQVFLQFINENGDNAYIDNVQILSGEAIELISPYPSGTIGDIRVTQSADVQYLWHDLFYPRKLERRGDVSWSLVQPFFEDGPYLAINPSTDLQKTQLIVNSGFDGGVQGWTRTVSGSADVNFSAVSGFVFLQRYSTAGSAQVEAHVVTAAPAKKHVLHFQIVGGGVTGVAVGSTSGGVDIVASANYPAGWYSISFIPNVADFYVNFTGDQDASLAGGVGGAFCYNTRAKLLHASATTGTVIITALDDFVPFHQSDVGRLIRMEHAGREPGYAVITAINDGQNVTAYVCRRLASIEPTETWQLGAWSSTTSYPKVGTFHQQRLIAANTVSQPQTIWGSQSGDFENMRPDSWTAGAVATEDDDAFAFSLAATRVSPILWMLSSRQLVVGTATGQWAITSKGSVLTPSDFSASQQTSVKGSSAAPVQVDIAGLFVHRAQRAVYDLAYQFQIDGYQAADLTMLARHITKGKVVQIVYQEEPFSQLWARLADGTLACLAYKRAQNLIGWVPVHIGGPDAFVESIAVIPGAPAQDGQVYNSDDRDELWMLVRRTIAGLAYRTIEVMEGYFEGPNVAEYAIDTNWKQAWKAAMRTAQKDAFYLDGGITYQGAPTSTVTATYLGGETVTVVADGAVIGDQQVALDGTITLSTPASTVHVGFSYPWNFRSLKLPFGSRTGPGVGTQKGMSGLVFALLDSAAFEYAIDFGAPEDTKGRFDFSPVSMRTPDDPMSGPPTLFTGERVVPNNGGFASDPRVILKGQSGLPFTLLGFGPQMDAKDQ